MADPATRESLSQEPLADLDDWESAHVAPDSGPAGKTFRDYQ